VAVVEFLKQDLLVAQAAQVVVAMDLYREAVKTELRILVAVVVERQETQVQAAQAVQASSS